MDWNNYIGIYESFGKLIVLNITKYFITIRLNWIFYYMIQKHAMFN